MERKLIYKMVVITIVLVLLYHNQFQTTQYRHGAIHFLANTKASYWDSFGNKYPSDRYKELLRFPDYSKAIKGIYEDDLTYWEMYPDKIPPKKEEIRDKEEFILDLIEKIKTDSNWYGQIVEKAVLWEMPIDSVLRKDAEFIWKKKQENK
jgi:hypothetical protein